MLASRYSVGSRAVYTPFRWPEFKDWATVRLSTIGDGSCLFHALCLAFYIPYRTEPERRREIVVAMRKDLAARLGMPGSDGQRPYDRLFGGNVARFAAEVGRIAPEVDFSFEGMKATLESPEQFVGTGYLGFIADQIQKDIIILHHDRQSVYVTGSRQEEAAALIKGRPTIVLYYVNEHFDLVGVSGSSGIITLFAPEDSFIVALRKTIGFDLPLKSEKEILHFPLM